MRRTGWLCLAAAIGMALGQGRAAADRLELAYDAYNSGFHIMSLELEIELDRNSYDVTARYRTAGVLSWIWPWESTARSRGKVHEGALLPDQHRVHSRVRGRERTVEIGYREGQAVAVQVLPPPPQDFEREPVGEAERRGAGDPMTAILAALREAQTTGACAGRRAVFDGRRRYDLEFRQLAFERLESGRQDRFNGIARACEFTYRPLGGFLRRTDDSERGRRVRTGRVWLAGVIPGAPEAPVRIEIDSEYWGPTIVHLRGAVRRADARQDERRLAGAVRRGD